MNVDSLLRAAGVRRWHTEPQLGASETVAHHSALTALIADELSADEFHLDAAERYYLLRECLRHDMGEYWTGDLPSPAKHTLTAELLAVLDRAEEEQRMKQLQYGFTPLVEVSSALLHLADSLSAGVHCAQQALLGNRDAVRILKMLVEYVRAQLNSTPLQLSTQLKAVRLLRECAMIADSELVLLNINGLEARICGNVAAQS